VAGESLRVLAGNASGTEIPLEGEFLIGRAAPGEGRLGDDREISRNHARISRGPDGRLLVEDLGSRNGTEVNGTRITEPQALTAGDTIKVGATTLQLLDSEGNAFQATALAGTGDAGATRASIPPAPPPPPAAATPPPAPATPPSDPPPAAQESPGGAMFIPPKPPPGGAVPPPRAPTPPPPAAPPPSFQPGGPVASHPATRAGGGGRRFAVLGLLAVVVAAVVVAVLVLGGGDDAAKTLSTREIVDQNRAATVNINTRGPARNDNGNRVVQTGGGTGVVIDAERGLVVTNAHVVSGATSLNASVGGDQIAARVRGQAPCEDLAVLQLRPVPGSLKSAMLGRARGIHAGDRVTALGYPGALESDLTQRKLQATEGTVSSGITSATISPGLPKYPALIQHQAPISPGNSGGPLFNDKGEVVGINTLASTGEGGRQNQNQAISIDRVRSLLPDLMANRDSGYVGWSLVPIDARTDFLFVEGTDAGSPADRAGLRFGDAIVELDNTPVGDVPAVCDIVNSKEPGDRLKVAGLEIPTGRSFVVNARLK
jgi:S1-C subfamily serine protease